MESAGIRRKVDDLGRIVVPAAIRHELGITEGDELEVRREGDRIVLARPGDRCTFCDGDQHVEAFRGRPVCWSCMAALQALARERAGESASPFGV